MQEQEMEVDYTGVVTADMMWDMLPAEAVLPLCPEAGVTPPDVEGARFEHTSSQARRAAIGPLLPWIEILSVIAAEIESIAVIRPLTPDPLPIERQVVQDTRDTYQLQAHDTILPAACAIVSLLVDRGFLTVTDKGRTATLDAFIGS